MRTYKDYIFESSNNDLLLEGFIPQMNKEIPAVDIKILAKLIMDDYSVNIQATEFKKVTNYIVGGKFVYNARKKYPNNPILVVYDSTNSMIYLVRFGDGSYGCYKWYSGNFHRNQKGFTMTAFNNAMEGAIVRGYTLSVFIAENPVRDRKDIRLQRAMAADVPDNGTIEDRLARKQFDENIKTFYLGKDRKETIDILLQNMIKVYIDAIKDEKYVYTSESLYYVEYKLDKVYREVQHLMQLIKNYEDRISNIEISISSGKKGLGNQFAATSKDFENVKSAIADLKAAKLWK